VAQAEAWGLNYGFGLCASPTTHILEDAEADICPVTDTFVFSLRGRKWVLTLWREFMAKPALARILIRAVRDTNRFTDVENEKADPERSAFSLRLVQRGG
jgi:hypothetical protein